MAVYFKMNILGLNILAFITLSQSFVLLTANMDDVRKLARKFVSESLAEQIAEFITKLSANPVDVSEENEKNMEQYRQTSGEHSRNKIPKTDDSVNDNRFVKKFKIARQRDRVSEKNQVKQRKGGILTTAEATSKGPEFPREINIKKQFVANQEKVMPNYKKEVTETKSNQNKQQWHQVHQNKHRPSGRQIEREYEKNDKDRDVNNFPENNADTNSKGQRDGGNDPEKILKHHLHTPTEKAEMNGLENKRQKPTKGRKKRRNKSRFLYSSTYSPPTADSSTLGSPELFNNNPSQSRYVKKSFGQITDEENKTGYIDEIRVQKKAEIREDTGYSIERTAKELSTAKVKIEFDQYDNRNYPKSEFVATSGSVALTKRPQENVSEGDSLRQRKAWF